MEYAGVAILIFSIAAIILGIIEQRGANGRG